MSELPTAPSAVAPGERGPARAGLHARAAALAGALVAGLLDWFYPRHCYHCGVPLEESRARILCRSCTEALVAARITGAVCNVCGLPLAAQPVDGVLCITCRAEARHFDLARSFLSYAGPASSVIRAFKFDGQFFLGPRFLAAMLDRGWLPADIGPADLVVPVPLHPQRRRERGYDQALLLSRVVAARLGGRLLVHALVRTRYTSQQSLLPVGKRWDNVRGAFAVRDAAAVRDRRVLLVDDVMTTGVTASECAKVLKKAGAAHVQVLTLARPAP
jgi:ComF family protein